uniref:Capsid assembly protein n=1 Tax=uncultured marine virus TaxID=186617 RepID=A0A0F7L6U0_9VIRU|nr:hypothetical protein [uncultured marine virus]
MTDETLTVEGDNQEAATDDNQSLLNVKSIEPETEEYEAPPHVEGDEPEAVAEPAEKPEYIDDQFWNAEKGELDAEKLATSYKELRAKMSAGKHKAPADGKYSVDELGDIDADDPMLADFLDIAKDEGFSQDQFERLTKFYLESQGALNEEIKYRRDEEMGKLGRNAEKIIGSMDAWLTKFGTSGTLSNDELEAIANASNNATFINAMNKIRRSYGESDIPPASASMDVGATTMDEIQELMADPRYGQDMAYTSRVEKKVYALHGESF